MNAQGMAQAQKRPEKSLSLHLRLILKELKEDME